MKTSMYACSFNFHHLGHPEDVDLVCATKYLLQECTCLMALCTVYLVFILVNWTSASAAEVVFIDTMDMSDGGRCVHLAVCLKYDGRKEIY